jgi:hypothetical protein
LEVGVGHPDNFPTAFRLTVALLPSGRLPVADAPFAAWEPVALPTVGDGQPFSAPVEPLPDVRGANARRAQIGGPDGIPQRFQVSAYSGEPGAAIA